MKNRNSFYHFCIVKWETNIVYIVLGNKVTQNYAGVGVRTRPIYISHETFHIAEENTDVQTKT